MFGATPAPEIYHSQSVLSECECEGARNMTNAREFCFVKYAPNGKYV